MPRWYAARRCAGRADTFVEQVRALVLTNRLARFLPGVHLERHARGQFYMFFAIESETPGHLPEELSSFRNHSVLRDLIPLADGMGVHPFSLDEIKRMVTGELDWQGYARLLFRTVHEPPVFAEPFPPDDAGDEAAVDDLLWQSQRYDRLILWMSAAGGGSLVSVQRACQALGLDSDGSEPGRILRRLQLLGHIERSADGTRWSVAPLVLARVADAAGGHGHVLCGERDTATLAILRRSASVVERPQSYGDAPARVFVATEDVEQLLKELRVSGARSARADAAAARLAEVLPSLDQWRDSLPVVPEVHPERYDVRRYRDGQFADAHVKGSGFYELWPRETRGGRTLRPDGRYFYDAARDRWLTGDWYSLRYVALIEDGVRPPAHYDIMSARLAIAEPCRPPAIYERALVLASGRLPERRGGWLYYDDIEPAIFTRLSAVLQLKLQEALPSA